MGVFLLWFHCDDIAELQKAKRKKLDQIHELSEEIKAIDEKIATLEG